MGTDDDASLSPCLPLIAVPFTFILQARTIDGSGNGLWSFKHADFHMTNDGYLGLCAPYGYGFGSVHYPRDIGDAEKLVFAISRKEEVGMVSTPSLLS